MGDWKPIPAYQTGDILVPAEGVKLPQVPDGHAIKLTYTSHDPPSPDPDESWGEVPMAYTTTYKWPPEGSAIELRDLYRELQRTNALLGKILDRLAER